MATLKTDKIDVTSILLNGIVTITAGISGTGSENTTIAGNLTVQDFLNVGPVTIAAVADGDFAAGDGIRELFWDASAQLLNIREDTSIATYDAAADIYINKDGEGGLYARIADNALGLNISSAVSNGSLAFPTARGSTAPLIQLEGLSYDGTSAYFPAASILLITDAVSAVGDHSGQIIFNTTPEGAFATNWVMQIRANGDTTWGLFAPNGETSTLKGRDGRAANTAGTHLSIEGGAGKATTAAGGNVTIVGGLKAGASTDGAVNVGTATTSAVTIGAAAISTKINGWVNVGSATGATALGDFSTGDGTRLLDYTASTGQIALTGMVSGVNAFSAIGNVASGSITTRLENQSAGAAALAQINLSSDAGTLLLSIRSNAATFPNESAITAVGGDMKLTTTDAGKDFIFATVYVDRWKLRASGNLETTGASNSYDIGSNTNRPRTLYLGTALEVGASATITPAIGDIVAGDATREMHWDTSNATLNLQDLAFTAVSTTPGFECGADGSVKFFGVVASTSASHFTKFRGYASDGSHATSLSNMAIDHGVADFFGFSWTTGTTYTGGSGMRIMTDATHTATSIATRLEFLTTPITTIASQIRMVINEAGGVLMGGAATTGSVADLTATAAAGDLVVGDGTREMFFDASLGNLVLSATAAFSETHTASTALFMERSASGCVVRQRSASATPTDHPVWIFQRSRGDTVTPTVLSNGDWMGSLTAQGYDGGAHRTAGAIEFVAEGTPASGTSMHGRIEFQTVKSGNIHTAGTPNGLFARWIINSDGHLRCWEEDDTYDIGAVGANRPRTGYFGTSLILGDEATTATIQGEDATTTDTAGAALSIEGGAGFATNANGGDVTIIGGALAGSGADGTINIGTSTTSDVTYAWSTFGGWSALDGVATATNFATLTTRNSHRVLEFADSTNDESAVFGDTGGGVMSPHYNGGDITVKLYWLAATATTGDVVWNVAWERHEDDVFDLDADGFAAVQAVTDTTASVSGELSVATITFTQAQADSIAASESFRLKVTRNQASGSDTMTGDAQLLRVTYEE